MRVNQQTLAAVLGISVSRAERYRKQRLLPTGKRSGRQLLFDLQECFSACEKNNLKIHPDVEALRQLTDRAKKKKELFAALNHVAELLK